jgi:hypothetical protein
MTGEAMERQERLWYYKRVHEAMKAATSDRRCQKRIKGNKRGEQSWYEKKVEHKCRQWAYETSGEAVRCKERLQDESRGREAKGEFREDREAKDDKRSSETKVESNRQLERPHGTVLVEEVKK